MSVPRMAVLGMLLSSPFLGTSHDDLQNNLIEFEGCISIPLVGASPQQPAPLDTNLYIECAQIANDRERYYITNVLRFYRQFSGAITDTSVTTVGDIDGNGHADTLKTRIYIESNDIHVYSQWTSMGDLKWEYDLVNPYKWISNEYPDLFAWDKRSPWMVFTIGILDSPPELFHPSHFRRVTIEMAARSGLWELEKLGHSITREDYIDYLREFKGVVMQYGHNEPIRNLVIWYAPLNRFISYYSP